MFFVLLLLVNLFHRAYFIIIMLTLLANGVVSLDETKAAKRRTTTLPKPNFVVFLVDDLGVGDIGCFGNDTIKTPNVDRLAERGAKLNHNLSPESICTPSRAAMLTGRYAIRSGLASGPDELRVISSLACSAGLPNNETTFAKVLQENGYRTSLIGKWHLGLHCESHDNCHHPLNMGFHEFYGLPWTNARDCGPISEGSSFLHLLQNKMYPVIIGCAVLGLAMVFTGVISTKYTIVLMCFSTLFLLVASLALQSVASRMCCLTMRGFEVVEQPTNLENLTVKFTNDAKRFIRENKKQPFLLFMSYAKVHAVLFTSPKFKGHSAHGRYGDNVEEMDWSVGEIVSALKEENLLENTLVYFTSDHGPFLEIFIPSTGERLGGSNGGYKGGKAQSWEGGIRVPTVAMWKDHIPPGITINEPTNSMDIFTTMIEIAGGEIPKDRTIDGKNIFPLLMQEQSVSPHEFMFHYCGSAIHAIRYRPRSGNVTWKAHFVTPVWQPGKEICDKSVILCECFGSHVTHHNPPLLYDVTHDPYERNKLDPWLELHQNIIIKMKQAMKNHQQEIKPVPKQLGYPNAWLNPHLQPCCNFPYCSFMLIVKPDHASAY